jgi:hypothetical protein
MDGGSLFVGLTILIPTVLALIIFNRDLKLKHEEGVAHAKDMKEIQEKELGLRVQQFNVEQEERKERLARMKEEQNHVRDLARPLSKEIAKELENEPKWAIAALEKSRMGPYSHTIFSERIEHFSEEKKLIAEKFAPLLLRRCRQLINVQHKDVCLLIDSGTTLYPFFDILASESVEAKKHDEEWLNHFKVATNNLPGIQKLMEAARENSNRYSPLALRCHLFPGEPLPVYSAVTGKLTNKAVEQLRQEEQERTQGHSVFISLVVGNWVRLRHTEPVCPVPLARGAGHKDFKEALIYNSDEIFVVTPLGKVFCNVDKETLNRALDFIPNPNFTDRHDYDEVDTIDKLHHEHRDKGDCIKIVTTSRPKPSMILFALSAHVQQALSHSSAITLADEIANQQFVDAPVGEASHVVFPFDRLPDDRYKEKDEEFPHKYTQREDFMENYRYIPRH